MSYIHLSLIRKLWIVNIILIHFCGLMKLSHQYRCALLPGVDGGEQVAVE